VVFSGLLVDLRLHQLRLCWHLGLEIVVACAVCRHVLLAQGRLVVVVGLRLLLIVFLVLNFDFAHLLFVFLLLVQVVVFFLLFVAVEGAAPIPIVVLVIVLIGQILIFINALQHAINLLLEQRLQLVNHEIVNWASLDEIGDEGLHCVSFIDDNPLQAEVSDIDIDVELGLTFILIGVLCTLNVVLALGLCLLLVFAVYLIFFSCARLLIVRLLLLQIDLREFTLLSSV